MRTNQRALGARRIGMNEIRPQNIAIERPQLAADVFVTEMLHGVRPELKFIEAAIHHEGVAITGNPVDRTSINTKPNVSKSLERTSAFARHISSRTPSRVVA